MYKFFSLLVFCAYFLFTTPSSANEIIKKIDVQGLKRISYETVLSYAEIETGSVYSNSISNNIINHQTPRSFCIYSNHFVGVPFLLFKNNIQDICIESIFINRFEVFI